MPTQPPKSLPADEWELISNLMDDDTNYVVSNETSNKVKIFEGNAIPSGGSADQQGLSFLGVGSQMFVTKVAGLNFYCLSPTYPSTIVISTKE